jgi:hypothetical protein
MGLLSIAGLAAGKVVLSMQNATFFAAVISAI